MNTLRRALGVLEGEGLIVRKQGKGTFIHPDLRKGAFRSPESADPSPAASGDDSAPDTGTIGVLAFDDNHGHCEAAEIYQDVVRGLLDEAQSQSRTISLSMYDGGRLSLRRFLGLLEFPLKKQSERSATQECFRRVGHQGFDAANDGQTPLDAIGRGFDGIKR